MRSGECVQPLQQRVFFLLGSTEALCLYAGMVEHNNKQEVKTKNDSIKVLSVLKMVNGHGLEENRDVREKSTQKDVLLLPFKVLCSGTVTQQRIVEETLYKHT